MTPNPISIAEVRTCDHAYWESVWRTCDYASYFHSPQWAEIWHRFKGPQVVAAAQRLTFADGKQAVVPFAANARGKGLLNTLTTSMEGTFGGWIASDALELGHALALTDYLLAGTGKNISWRINPYDPFAGAVLERVRARSGSIDLSGSKRQKALGCALNFNKPLQVPDDTHTLDLSSGFGALYGSQSSITRKAKKARKGGVAVRVAETLEDWKEYYSVYQSSVQRWGNDPASSYDWELFRVMFELRSPEIKLWLATADSRIVSGALCFYAKRHVVYWHGSSLEQYFELRPVNLLMYEIIKHCCEQGYGWYDFNPSGQMQGVITFKESFGAKPMPCPLVYVDTPIKRAARGVLLGLKGYL